MKDVSLPATAPVAPLAAPDTDPDRPSLKRLGEVPALMSYDAAFPDISGVPRNPFRVSVAAATAALDEEDAEEPKEPFKMPTLPSSRCLFTDQGLPDYFGKGLDDAEEGFSDYSAAPNDNPGYKLIPPTLDPSFEAAAAANAKATAAGLSGSLPVPSVNDVWKPLTPAGARTAYFQQLPAPGGQVRERVEPQLPQQLVVPSQAPTAAAPVSDGISDVTRDQLLKRIQDLTDRLNQLEKTQPARNSQQEVLIFVGVGLFTLLTFDMAMRFSRR